MERQIPSSTHPLGGQTSFSRAERHRFDIGLAMRTWSLLPARLGVAFAARMSLNPLMVDLTIASSTYSLQRQISASS